MLDLGQELLALERDPPQRELCHAPTGRDKDRAHGAQVPPGKVVQAGWLVMGVPAKPARKMSPEELEDVLRNASDDAELWRRDYGEGRSRAVV